MRRKPDNPTLNTITIIIIITNYSVQVKPKPDIPTLSTIIIIFIIVIIIIITIIIITIIIIIITLSPGEEKAWGRGGMGVYPLHNFSPEVGGGRLHGNGRLQGTLQYYPVQVRPKHDNQTLNDSVSVSDPPESWPERRRLSWPSASQLPSGLPA